MRLEKELKEISGNLPDIKKFFAETVLAGKLANSYLFTGGDYPGKIEAARYLSRAVNCREALAGRDCSCDVCARIENSNFPDVVWIKPSSQKIKIENIRNIIRRMYLKPYAAKQKIFVLEDAENLTEEAQNGFLKTLEEPPSGCLIILMAHQKEQLLETVVSRCRIVKFLSDYSVPAQKMDEFVRNFLSEKNRLELLSSSVKNIGREELEEILGGILIWFRDALVCSAGRENLCINAGKENMPGIRETAFRYSLVELEKIIQEIVRLKNLCRHNVNPKICLSVLAVNLENIDA